VISGIHLAHKKIGETSFDLVRAFNAAQKAERITPLPVGHGGTLDPFAEGLLLVLVGQATRLMELMHPLPKTYLATLKWGVETENGDPTGKILAEGDPSGLTPAALDAALKPFMGWTEQVPHATSAKKIGGEAAYKKAHRGEVVEMSASKVFLHAARFVSHDLPRTSVLELTCRGGFYVRALARDLGKALGCQAHLIKLHRTAIGPWLDPGLGQTQVVTGEALLPWCQSRQLTDAELTRLGQGQRIARGDWAPPTWALPEGFPDPGSPLRALHGGKLVALLREQDGQLAVQANLRGGI
jgi:tRNA pseudouridine55 synthase